MCSVRKLVIVSHVAHYRYGGELLAYGPYAREIDIWADLFSQIVIAAPCYDERPPDSCLAFSRSNISIQRQKETGGETWGAKLKQIVALPSLVWRLTRTMREGDAIHVRCPGNLGLLGVILAPLFSRYLIAKFAGQWNRYPGEPSSVRLQRALLGSRWWRGPVTVYGTWPDQPAHVVPFFTSVLSDVQVERARIATRNRPSPRSLRVLYVGRLSAAKNVNVLLSAVADLRREAIDLELSVVGEGPQRSVLESQANELRIGDDVTFVGAVDFEQVHTFYEQSDVLVLVSETEGWPKAITEAMAFGLICIGSDRGLVPSILGEGRGIVIPPGDHAALSSTLRQIANSPSEFDSMRQRAATWAQQYTLESLKDSLRELLTRHWRTQLDDRAQIRASESRALDL